MKKFLVITVLIIILVVGGLLIFKPFKEEKKIHKVENKDRVFEVYKAGDKVDFYDDSWYVLYNSGSNQDYVTLISSKISFFEEAPLVMEGIYETSDLNKYFKETLSKEYGEDNLVEINGYSIRLFNEDDMKKLLDVTYDKKNDSYKIDNCPDYICLNHNSVATMIDSDNDFEKVDVYNNIKDIEGEEYSLHSKYYFIVGEDDEYRLDSIIHNTALIVRPVINVYKDSLIEQDPYHYENFGE